MATSAVAPTIPITLEQRELNAIIKPADIILTRAPGAVSGVIQKGSCSKYSHAILALYHGQCVEAVTPRVRVYNLYNVLKKKTYAAIYRHKLLPEGLPTRRICDYATDQKRKKYDSAGAANSGAVSGCGGVWMYSPAGKALNGASKMATKDQQDLDDKFFCSELVSRAFEVGGYPLFKRKAHLVTPGLIPMSPHLELVQVIHDAEYS